MSLPTMDQLAQLASTIYGQKIEPYQVYSDLRVQEGYKKALTFGSYWSSELFQSNGYGVYVRSILGTYSASGNGAKDGSRTRAVCILN